jgi:hypothetical protein
MNSRKHWLEVLLILFGLTASATPQEGPVNSGNLPYRDPGSATISGRVMLPSGLTSGAHVKIILSNTQAPLTTLYSDKNGEFHFDNLQAGTYYLQVFADESVYDPLSQRVLLKPGEPVHLVLSLKEKTAPRAKPRAAVSCQSPETSARCRPRRAKRSSRLTN